MDRTLTPKLSSEVAHLIKEGKIEENFQEYLKHTAKEMREALHHLEKALSFIKQLNYQSPLNIPLASPQPSLLPSLSGSLPGSPQPEDPQKALYKVLQNLIAELKTAGMSEGEIRNRYKVFGQDPFNVQDIELMELMVRKIKKDIPALHKANKIINVINVITEEDMPPNATGSEEDVGLNSGMGMSNSPSPGSGGRSRKKDKKISVSIGLQGPKPL